MRPRYALGIAAGAAMLCAAPAALAATTYDYDSLGRLVRVIYDNGSSAAYCYDAAGNRKTVCQLTGGAPCAVPATPC